MKNPINSISITLQLFICFLLFITIPVCAIYGIYSRNYKDFMVQNFITHSKNELQILSENFSEYLGQFKTLNDFLFTNHELINVVGRQNDSNYVSTHQYRIDLETAIKNIFYTTKNINTIIFVDNQNNSVSIGDSYISTQRDQLINQYKDKMYAADGAVVWGSMNIGGQNRILICKKFNYSDDNYVRSYFGYIMMIINEQSFYNYYKDIDAISQGKFFMCDNNGNIISSNMRDSLHNVFTANTKFENNDIILFDGLDYYQANCKLNSNKDWNITTLISKKDIEKRISTSLFNVLILSVICIIISAFISLVLSKNFTKPIFNLLEKMKCVENGQFDVHIYTTLKNEIAKLYNGFNNMTDNLNTLFNKNIAMELKTKEAQLLAYERQMNPHFMYNTLDTIRMFSILGESEKIDDVIVCLSEMLRFNLKSEKEVLIEDEIKNMDYYFRILKTRYVDTFNYTIDIQPGIEKFSTLKFLLQPFIENAVIHGLENVERKGYIKVLAKKINDEIVFIIKDNGIGIQPENIAKIKLQLENTYSYNKASIGMQNVHQRIRTQYGDKYGIDIKSIYNEHTTIIIHIPAYIKESDSIDFQNDYS